MTDYKEFFKELDGAKVCIQKECSHYMRAATWTEDRVINLETLYEMFKARMIDEMFTAGQQSNPFDVILASLVKTVDK